MHWLIPEQNGNHLDHHFSLLEIRSEFQVHPSSRRFIRKASFRPPLKPIKMELPGGNPRSSSIRWREAHKLKCLTSLEKIHSTYTFNLSCWRCSMNRVCARGIQGGWKVRLCRT